jgi:hypothetical protein
MQNFFTYLFEFCKLQALEIARLRELQEQFEVRFFSSNKVIKFFKQLSSRCSFFNTSKSQDCKTDEEEISVNENSDLLKSEYARLNTNYLTMNR